ncbi:MAG TPA: hypothetical protein VG406_28245 [Isosphaeraceae bacterium]|jgi:hypothetical protein|nr:hypothetical protein [Isosphaeraceae bacterium]
MQTPDGGRVRRVRVDAWAGAGGFDVLGPRFKGRRVVLGALLGVLVLWGALALAFRGWKARQLDRASYGARRVEAAIGPWERVEPPGIGPAAWREAVGASRALLVAVVGSGAMEKGGMDALADDVAGRVSASRPETAPTDLLRLWADLGRRAGPIVARSRPGGPLVLASAVAPLAAAAPEGVDRAEWLDAVVATEALLVEVSSSGRLSPDRIATLRETLSARVYAASPRTSRSVLSGLWDDLPREAGITPRAPRPSLLDGSKAR